MWEELQAGPNKAANENALSQERRSLLPVATWQPRRSEAALSSSALALARVAPSPDLICVQKRTQLRTTRRRRCAANPQDAVAARISPHLHLPQAFPGISTTLVPLRGGDERLILIAKLSHKLAKVSGFLTAGKGPPPSLAAG